MSIYVKELDCEFFLVGSVGRRWYFRELHAVFSSVSDTLPKLLEEDIKKPETKHDIDLLYVGNIDKLAERYPETILRKTVDMLVIKKKDKSFHPKVHKYDIFVSPVSPRHYRYFYYIFSAFGVKINIILRKKMMRKNMKLNRRGVFRNNIDVSDEISFNHRKNIFFNVKQILKYIYK